MHVHQSKQIQMDLEVEAKDSADQWKATFDVAGKRERPVALSSHARCDGTRSTGIETMTAKTGNFKSFGVFISMLENAINQVSARDDRRVTCPSTDRRCQESSSVSIDLFTYDDLEALRKKRQSGQTTNAPPSSSNVQLANKRYLILTYNAEFDRIYYPLSLPYCGKPDPVLLMQQLRQLKAENVLLKSRVSDGRARRATSTGRFVSSWSRTSTEAKSFGFNESKRTQRERRRSTSDSFV
jgi:coiled-coil domain-containing protein 61